MVAAYELVMKSNGLQKTKELATFHAQVWWYSA